MQSYTVSVSGPSLQQCFPQQSSMASRHCRQASHFLKYSPSLASDILLKNGKNEKLNYIFQKSGRVIFHPGELILESLARGFEFLRKTLITDHSSYHGDFLVTHILTYFPY